MTKLIIKKEYVRLVEKPANVLIDNKEVGAVTNGGELTVDISAGSHTILALGLVENVPKHQYELIINNSKVNIIEIKVNRIWVVSVFTMAFVAIILSAWIGLFMLNDTDLALLGALFLFGLVGILYLTVVSYSKHMYSIEAVSGAKLTPLSEDKKYR